MSRIKKFCQYAVFSYFILLLSYFYFIFFILEVLYFPTFSVTCARHILKTANYNRRWQQTMKLLVHQKTKKMSLCVCFMYRVRTVIKK